jgi:hypothetical protein
LYNSANTKKINLRFPHPFKIKNHSTQDSRVVPHRGTNWAALCLTAQIRRDAVHSESYGRGYSQHPNPIFIYLISLYQINHQQSSKTKIINSEQHSASSSDIQRKVYLFFSHSNNPRFPLSAPNTLVAHSLSYLGFSKLKGGNISVPHWGSHKC